MGILIGKAPGVDVAGGITTCGLVALVVPDVSLQRHKQAAGDLAGVVRDIGHHPLDVFLRGHVHFTQAGLCYDLIPQRIRIRAGGRAVGIRLQKALCSVTIGITQIHTVELSACCGGRPVAVRLAGRRQTGRPKVRVCYRRNSNAGGLCREGRCREQRQDGQQGQKKGYDSLFHKSPFRS